MMPSKIEPSCNMASNPGSSNPDHSGRSKAKTVVLNSSDSAGCIQCTPITEAANGIKSVIESNRDGKFEFSNGDLIYLEQKTWVFCCTKNNKPKQYTISLSNGHIFGRTGWANPIRIPLDVLKNMAQKLNETQDLGDLFCRSFLENVTAIATIKNQQRQQYSRINQPIKLPTKIDIYNPLTDIRCHPPSPVLLAFRGIKTTPHGVWFSKQKHLPNHKKNDHLLFFLEKKLPFPVCVLMDGSGSFAPNTTVGALKHQMHQQGEALFTTLWEYLNNGNNNQAIDTLSHFISTSVANTTGSSTFCCAIRTNKILHIISQGDSSALVFNGPNQTVTELTSDSEASFWYDSKGIQSPYYFKQCGGQPRLTHIRHDIQTGDQLCLMTDGVSNFFEKIGVEPVERQSTIIPSIYTTPSHQLTELITPLVQCLAFNPKKIALALYTLHEHIRHVHPDDATCYISSVFN